jgi:hypothetical protein
MVDGIVAFLFMGLIIFSLVLLYKNRRSVYRWLNDADMVAGDDPKIKRLNTEHKIAVLQRRLEIQNSMDKEQSKGGD